LQPGYYEQLFTVKLDSSEANTQSAMDVINAYPQGICSLTPGTCAFIDSASFQTIGGCAAWDVAYLPNPAGCPNPTWPGQTFYVLWLLQPTEAEAGCPLPFAPVVENTAGGMKADMELIVGVLRADVEYIQCVQRVRGWARVGKA
jgi:hypothetical protein